MAEINQAKLVALVKKGKNQAECARELGVTAGQLGMLKYGQALVEAGKLKKAPATAKSVKELRDKESMRWEFIAARTGLSVAKVKELYGDKPSYVGRGPKPGGSKSKSAAKSSAKKTGVRHVATGKKKTAARGGRGATTPRARTRAERAARSSNPS